MAIDLSGTYSVPTAGKPNFLYAPDIKYLQFLTLARSPINNTTNDLLTNYSSGL